jgi:hypothetical protein
MKIKDLPNGTSMATIKVILPDEVTDADLNLVGLTQRDVYISSVWGYGTPESSGIWVSTERGGSGRVYPITGHEGKEALEWEVWEEGQTVATVDPLAQHSAKEKAKWEGAVPCG